MTPDNQTDPDQQKQEIAGIFSRAAPTYDRVGPQFFTRFGRRLVELAQIPSGAQVLDVATGKGAVLFAAAESAGVDGRAIGIDLSEGMVRETSHEIRRLELPNVEARQMDAEHLEFPDQSFDFVLCGFAIFFFLDLDRTLADFCRVLKPNGRLALTSWGNTAEDEQWKWLDELVEEYLPAEDKKKDSAEPSSSTKPDLYSQDGIKELLQESGFQILHLSSETDEFSYKSEDEWWAVQWSHGARDIFEKIESAHGTDGLKRFKTAVFTELSRMKQSDGIHEVAQLIYAVAVKPQD